MRKSIKGYFQQLPAALQEQILFRAGIGLALGICSLGILLYTKAWILGLPGLILTLFMIVNSLLLLYNCGKGRYVVVTGRCAEVVLSGVKKRVKSLRVISEGKMLTIFIPHKRSLPAVEDLITIYLPENAPVYEVDGSLLIYRFYALKISRKV